MYKDLYAAIYLYFSILINFLRQNTHQIVYKLGN